MRPSPLEAITFNDAGFFSEPVATLAPFKPVGCTFAPDGNPFNDGSNSIRSKVWAYGLRNPFRFGLHPTTSVPMIGDVGWDTWEEINQGVPGANYGWPRWEDNAQQPRYQASFPTQCQPVTVEVVNPPPPSAPVFLYGMNEGSGMTA